nr:hypothetical protein [Tanacetum cinerariifolium]
MVLLLLSCCKLLEHKSLKAHQKLLEKDAAARAAANKESKTSPRKRKRDKSCKDAKEQEVSDVPDTGNSTSKVIGAEKIFASQLIINICYFTYMICFLSISGL